MLSSHFIRPLLCSCLLMTAQTGAIAEPSQPTATATANAEKGQSLPPRQIALDRLFSVLEPEELADAVKAAQKAGVHPQAIIEARFLQLVDHEDYEAIAAMVPELLKQKDQFNSDNSEIFAVKEDWFAIIHYAQALEALQSKDTKAFKQHITEAFWLSPRQGRAFAPHIDKFRMQQEMAKIQLQPELQFAMQDGTPAKSWKDISAGKKAVILHFWSPMSLESQQHLETFGSTAKICNQHQVAVVSILVASTPHILKDAELLRLEEDPDKQNIWTIDPAKGSLANRLRITDIPTMVIATPSGRILFNGPPSNPEFAKQLHQFAPDFPLPDPDHKKPHDHVHSDG